MVGEGVEFNEVVSTVVAVFMALLFLLLLLFLERGGGFSAHNSGIVLRGIRDGRGGRRIVRVVNVQVFDIAASEEEVLVDDVDAADFGLADGGGSAFGAEGFDIFEGDS